MNIKNIMGLLAIFLFIGISFADQVQQKQQQKQDQKQSTDSSQADNDYLSSPEYLKKLEQEFQTRASGQTAKDTEAKHENQVHERICPTCGNFSSLCPVDQERLSRGIVLICGCGVCGGNGHH